MSDIHQARAELAGRGVEVSEVDVRPWGSFVFFTDPDGNRWAVQQLPDYAAGQAARAQQRLTGDRALRGLRLERRRRDRKIKNSPTTRQSSPMASHVGLPVMKLPLMKPAP